MAKVAIDHDSSCWLWTAGKTDGYGVFWFDGRTMAAHRFAYEWFVGPIPEGFTIDHVEARGCISRSCVNPRHLEPVTVQENIRRRGAHYGIETWQGQKTHCPKGHPYNETNTIRWRNSRTCRTCRRTYQNAYRARRKAMAA